MCAVVLRSGGPRGSPAVRQEVRKQQVLSSNLSVGSSPQSRSESPHSAANPVPSTCHNAEDLLTERSSVRQGRRPKLHKASQRRRGSRPQSASHAVSDAAGLACAALDGNSASTLRQASRKFCRGRDCGARRPSTPAQHGLRKRRGKLWLPSGDDGLARTNARGSS